MLKALELSGFKSFADKTRIEFPPGITVVVGPNGSGKSNIVDALKWVLGEQSAKSLRGKEMADVIFKGVTGGRKPMHTAEVTVVLENDNGLLPVDAPEVHVTRRVYRSGEGEYLINREPCRLKDIREMFRGTGVGVDAYSLIEQGKVDRMLQASSKDRRAIFEEAAGISRFKAKKVEAIRRLDRVEQNFLRLSDIVEEVESRLKTVRSQASKAKRYREHTERLQSLRTQVGMVDWRRLTDAIDEIESNASQLAESIAELEAEAASSESAAAEIQGQVESTAVELRTAVAEFTSVREQIVALKSNRDHQRSRCSEWEDALKRQRKTVRELSSRVAAFAANIVEAESHADDLANQHDALLADERQRNQDRAERTEQLVTVRSARDQLQQQVIDHKQQAAALENRVTLLTAQIDSAANDLAIRQERVAESNRQSETLGERIVDAQREHDEFVAELAAISAELDSAQGELKENRQRLMEKRQIASELQARHLGAVHRSEVLAELENRLDGLDAGVKEILSNSESASDPTFAGVRGLVAHMVRVDMDKAALIDAALGPAAQHIVVEGSALTTAIANGEFQPAGRVGLIQLDADPPHRAVEKIDLSWHDSVIGRADRLVEVDEANRPLVHRLLAHTWLVDSLEAALDLSKSAGRGLRFVTESGQVVEADGAVIVGPAEKTLGLVSRRSELRSLEQSIEDLSERLEDLQAEIDEIAADVGNQDEAVGDMLNRHRDAASAVTQAESRVASLNDQQQQFNLAHQALLADLQSAADQQQKGEAERQSARETQQETQAAVVKLQTQFDEIAAEVIQAEEALSIASEHATAARVAVASNSQQLESARTRLQQLTDSQNERRRAVAEARQQLAETEQRRQSTELKILQTTSELAAIFVEKETLHRESNQLEALQKQQSEQLAEYARLGAGIERKLRKQEEESRRQVMEGEKLRLERNSLAERLRDDYGIEIAEIDVDSSLEATEQRDAIESEISSLRQKISNAGAVNMDALQELDELEERYQTLSSQYNDLTDARKSLERIIARINTDSRRLFAETLDVIRDNFRTLFRKSFGGGQADLLLEEGVDILESGIEIVATPPGKPQFSNSLLSGGERALTAVALIMAIFQFRPSPFCVLDEVDAPFDEANVGRFVNVLTEFLGFTRFVIVTHSKKTMTSASTLYGITMQESGVSKPVSVRFEDVSEDGEISDDAIRRDGEDAA